MLWLFAVGHNSPEMIGTMHTAAYADAQVGLSEWRTPKDTGYYGYAKSGLTQCQQERKDYLESNYRFINLWTVSHQEIIVPHPKYVL